jgi:hypothetical protein
MAQIDEKYIVKKLQARKLPVPALWLVKPLVGVDSDLGSERFGENEDVSDDSGIRAETK